MKLTHKLCGAALLAILGTSLVSPIAALAEGSAENHSGKGTIKFTEDTGDDKVEDPEGEEEIVEPEVNPTNGPLKVIAVTDLNFGTNKVTPAPGTGWVYTASAADVTVKDNEGKSVAAKRANFVQFKDTRAEDGKSNLHKLSAKATPFTNESGKELKSAELQFSNILLTNKANEEQVVNEYDKAKVLPTDGATSVTFVDQKDPNKGFGQFTLQFGQLADENADKSVQLVVPSTNKLSTTSGYSSTITWTIEDAR